MKVIQCVPNFSEGKDNAKIKRIMSSIEGKDGFNVVSVESDPAYNRTVVTLIGDLDAIKDSLLEFACKIESEIDLNSHVGEHSRMGALDVVPFIPISNVTMDECINASRELGEKIAKKLNIPVYLYEESASNEERRNLANVRRGEFEGLSEKMKSPDWKPDFGPSSPHKTFGAIAICARNPLVAFNIDLDTKDIEVSKYIAKVIRHSGGGYRFIKAGGVELLDRGITQVTMNITDYTKTAMYRVFETVKFEAKAFNVNVTGCEIVGLTPAQNLIDSMRYYENSLNKSFDLDKITFDDMIKNLEKNMNLYGFNKEKIIEYYL